MMWENQCGIIKQIRRKKNETMPKKENDKNEEKNTTFT